MPGDYTKQAQSALAALKRKGKKLVITRHTADLDPVTQVDTGSSTNYDCWCVCFPISQSTLGQMSQSLQAKLEGRKSLDVTMAAYGLAITPEPGDVLVRGENDLWSVVGTNPLAPVGVGIIHQLLVVQ